MLKGNSQHQLRPHQALCAGQHIVAQDICTRITKAQHKVLLPDLPLSLALAQGEAVLSQLKHRHLCRCPFASGEILLAAMHKDVPSLLFFFFAHTSNAIPGCTPSSSTILKMLGTLCQIFSPGKPLTQCCAPGLRQCYPGCMGDPSTMWSEWGHTALKALSCNVAASPFHSCAEAGGIPLWHMPLAVRPGPRSLVASKGTEETPCRVPEPSMHGGFNPSLSVLALCYSAHIWKRDVFLFLKQEALCFPREVPHIIMWEFRNQMPRS